MLDYGTLTRATVLARSNYWSAAARTLPDQTAQLTVTCPHATVVGLSWSDNRASTRMGFDINDGARFGLANTNVAGQALGGYELAYGTPTTTTGGAINATFIQPASGGSWATGAPSPANVPLSYIFPNYVNAFGRTATSTTTPVPLLDYSVPLTAKAYVSATIVSASTSSILIDGSATVTLKYF